MEWNGWTKMLTGMACIKKLDWTGMEWASFAVYDCTYEQP